MQPGSLRPSGLFQHARSDHKLDGGSKDAVCSLVAAHVPRAFICQPIKPCRSKELPAFVLGTTVSLLSQELRQYKSAHH